LLHFAAACLFLRTTEIARSRMIIFVSVSMFDYKPECYPFGHLLWYCWPWRFLRFAAE